MQTLADRWGVREGLAGRTIWFELDLPTTARKHCCSWEWVMSLVISNAPAADRICGIEALIGMAERLHVITAINPIPPLIDRRSEAAAYRLGPVGR